MDIRILFVEFIQHIPFKPEKNVPTALMEPKKGVGTPTLSVY